MFNIQIIKALLYNFRINTYLSKIFFYWKNPHNLNVKKDFCSITNIRYRTFDQKLIKRMKCKMLNAPPYKIVDLNSENIENYDLFCSKEKNNQGYQNKVEWLRERFKEGLRYKLLMIQNEENDYESGGFIEYIPGELVWRGIHAPGWMAIHCILVSNKYHNLKFGSKLLEECYNDAKGTNGVVILTSIEGGWEPTNSLFVKQGFQKVDEFPPFELMAKKFVDDAPSPKFNVQEMTSDEKKLKLYGIKTYQCPYDDHMSKLLKEVAKEINSNLTIKELKDSTSVQENGLHPYATFCVFSEGEFLTRMPYSKEDILKPLNKLNQVSQGE
ncbi:hypothetical protein LCGC14_1122210 [marine sediment metagenome]|uniref:N-acetyltransferase domain-containing protein n=1 Tax=marine sediment metagenome TaxID=412755 RepID=A0A0F9M3M0_9ZZZZ